MGVVADTSVFTVCERRRWTANRVATRIAELFPDESVVIPSIAAAEMVDGIYRAKTDIQFRERESFVELLLTSYPVVAFTEETARISGRIRGEQAKLGNTLPLGDSMIAAIALEWDYAVLTHNIKDFTRIPNLRVIPFTLP